MMKSALGLCFTLFVFGYQSQVALGGIPKDPACGQTKGCTPDCSAGDCKYLITWANTGDAILFEFSTDVSGQYKGENWTAVGFSNDDKMNGTSVVACIENNEVIVTENSYNMGTANIPQKNSGLMLQSSSVNDGILYCKFTRAKSVPGEMFIYDLHQDWILIHASGPAEGGVKRKHSVPPVATKMRVNLTSTDIVPANSPQESLYFEPRY